MNQIGIKIKTLRKERKLSQESLSHMIGISKASVTMYELGERKPKYEIIEKFAEYFNVDIDYLLGKSDNTVTSLKTEGLFLSDKEYTTAELQKIQNYANSLKNSRSETRHETL